MFAIEPAIPFMTIYVMPLFVRAQYTFGTGIEVLRATNCIVLASVTVVTRDALIPRYMYSAYKQPVLARWSTK